MKIPVRRLSTLLAAAAMLPRVGGAQGTGGAPVIKGAIEVAGVTGAVMLSGDRLLLTSADENGVFTVQQAVSRLRGGRVGREAVEAQAPALQGKVKLQDLQDAAWDGTGDAFVVTSHARTPRGDSPEERYRLAQLHFDATGKLIEAAQTDALLQALVNEVPFLADSIRRTPARAGLNIEGLAWDPAGQLLVGMRAPTVTESAARPHGGQEDAVVVRVKNPDALFVGAGQAALLGDTVKLDLHGQGIRGMCYDPERKAYWILSGLSVLPNHPVKSPWGLWLWDGRVAAREAAVPPGLELEEPDAICRVEVDGKARLLLVEAGKPASRYALILPPDGFR
ncbi:MAG TPA: DUF3616 domain-containing protein [Armatimonadota bacterium]|nr:DUF3616 domain-containing protein [Armatimonadota bacterium]